MIFKATERINQIQRDALKKNYANTAQDWGE
jgi:hypothetical protein